MVRDKWLAEKCPAISVGGPGGNELSKQWIEAAAQNGVQPFPLANGSGLYLSGPPPRAVLYGPGSAADSRSAVLQYINAPRGLPEFLQICWKI
jgi:hypothetical protein